MSIQLKAAYDEFYSVAKLMNKTDISTNRDTLNKYRSLIIPAYNKFVNFINGNYARVKQNDQYILDDSLERARSIFVKCLSNLKCTHELPDDLRKLIEVKSVGPVPGANASVQTSKPSTSAIVTEANEPPITTLVSKTNEILKPAIVTETRKPSESVNKTNEKINSEKIANDRDENDDENNDDDDHRDDDDVNNSDDSEDSDGPIMNSLELFNAVNRQFKQNYSGDPLGLTSFIDAVDLLSDFATTPVLQANLLKYVTAKLDGRAREFITEDVNSLQDLKNVLRENIVPENSKVIEGRITSLRYAYSRQEEFASKAEELADALRRTLIIEGMTAAKANEISVDKTIQLCRKSTNSDLVKSVLAATAFKSPKEVIAKLITESDVHVKEQQILRFQKFNKGQNGNNSGNKNKNGRDRNKGHKPNGQNNGSNSNNYQGRQYNNNYRGRNGQRGRGNGNNNRRYNDSNYNNGYQNGQYQNNYGNQNNGGPNVRVAHSGNESGPQQMNMGAPVNQMFQ